MDVVVQGVGWWVGAGVMEEGAALLAFGLRGLCFILIAKGSCCINFRTGVLWLDRSLTQISLAVMCRTECGWDKNGGREDKRKTVLLQGRGRQVLSAGGFVQRPCDQHKSWQDCWGAGCGCEGESNQSWQDFHVDRGDRARLTMYRWSCGPLLGDGDWGELECRCLLRWALAAWVQLVAALWECSDGSG